MDYLPGHVEKEMRVDQWVNSIGKRTDLENPVPTTDSHTNIPYQLPSSNGTSVDPRPFPNPRLELPSIKDIPNEAMDIDSPYAQPSQNEAMDIDSPNPQPSQNKDIDSPNAQPSQNEDVPLPKPYPSLLELIPAEQSSPNGFMNIANAKPTQRDLD